MTDCTKVHLSYDLSCVIFNFIVIFNIASADIITKSADPILKMTIKLSQLKEFQGAPFLHSPFCLLYTKTLKVLNYEAYLYSLNPIDFEIDFYLLKIKTLYCKKCNGEHVIVARLQYHDFAFLIITG